VQQCFGHPRIDSVVGTCYSFLLQFQADMPFPLTITELQEIIGPLGEPIPKIKKAQRQHLRTVLKGDEIMQLDSPAWALRVCVALGMAPPWPVNDPIVLLKALTVRDVARHIRKFCSLAESVEAKAALEAIRSALSKQNARAVLKALEKLAFLPAKKRGTRQTKTVRCELEPETASALLGIATRLSTLIVRPSEGEPSKMKSEQRRAVLRRLLALIFRIAGESEDPRVCGAALELISQLHRELGVSQVEELIGLNHQPYSDLLSSPVRLLPRLLLDGCLRDAEFLAARATLLDESKKKLEECLHAELRTKGGRLPLASRQWAEEFLGQDKQGEVRSRLVDTSSDINLERMATVLLAAWEAKEEGERANSLFRTISGICKTAFRLSLSGEVDEQALFDSQIHESVGSAVLPGQRVKLLRPWVQWSDGVATRIIVRALVAPLEA